MATPGPPLVIVGPWRRDNSGGEGGGVLPAEKRSLNVIWPTRAQSQSLSNHHRTNSSTGEREVKIPLDSIKV